MFRTHFHERRPWITKLAMYIPLGVPSVSVFTIRIGDTRYAATYVGKQCISKLKMKD